MKYYVYISRTKVEMLHGQIGAAKANTRDASIGFDLKILKGEIKESRPIDHSIYTQLNETVAELDKAGLIGGIESGSHQFIRGTCKMAWSRSDRWEGEAPAQGITLWTHKSDAEKLVLALAGSSYHVLGETRIPGTSSHSATPLIANWIRKNIMEPFSEDSATGLDDPWESHHHVSEHTLLNYGIFLAAELADRPDRKQATFEFVAVVLHRGEHDG